LGVPFVEIRWVPKCEIGHNGPQLVALFVFGIAVFTTVKVVTEDRAEYEKNFYEINSSARLQKAYYLFFKLWEKGRAAKAGVPTDRHAWDEDVQRALREYCNESGIGVYLSNTGRHEPGSDFRPIPEEKYDTALEFRLELFAERF
jgi:hypothetical protein